MTTTKQEMLALAERVEAGDASYDLDVALAEASRRYSIPIAEYNDSPVNYDSALWVMRHGRPDIPAAAIRDLADHTAREGGDG